MDQPSLPTPDIIPLDWPSALRPLAEFHQNQFSLPITGPVECVTASVVAARNMVNDLLAFRTGRARLPDQNIHEYIEELDQLGWWGLPYRFPTNFPDITIPFTSTKYNPRGFMLPRSQALRALKRIAGHFRRHYGSSFSVRQSSARTLQDIARNLQDGNLVLVSGLFDPAGKEQALLGGSPHTYGPVTEVNFISSTITVIDTGSLPLTTSRFEDFNKFWGRKSMLNLYTKPSTLTILALDPDDSPQ